MVHGKLRIVLDAVSTDDILGSCLPKYDLVIKNSNVLSSTTPRVNPLCIAAEAVMSIGMDSLTGLRTSAGLFSQLIDQPGKRGGRRGGAGVPGQSQKTSNQKPGPNPPEHKLNDSQPLTDNKTSIKFA